MLNKFAILDIKDGDVNYQNSSITFGNFNKALNEERSSDRFLAALKLKNHLYHNSFQGITKDEILPSESHPPL